MFNSQAHCFLIVFNMMLACERCVVGNEAGKGGYTRLE